MDEYLQRAAESGPDEVIEIEIPPRRDHEASGGVKAAAASFADASSMHRMADDDHRGEFTTDAEEQTEGEQVAEDSDEEEDNGEAAQRRRSPRFPIYLLSSTFCCPSSALTETQRGSSLRIVVSVRNGPLPCRSLLLLSPRQKA